MIEMFGVGLMVAIFMVIVYIIPIWLLKRWNNENPR